MYRVSIDIESRLHNRLSQTDRFSRQAVIWTQDRLRVSLLISCLLCCCADGLIKVTTLCHSKRKGHFCKLGLLSRDKVEVSFNARYSYSEEMWIILMIQACVRPKCIVTEPWPRQQIIQMRNPRLFRNLNGSLHSGLRLVPYRSVRWMKTSAPINKKEVSKFYLKNVLQPEQRYPRFSCSKHTVVPTSEATNTKIYELLTFTPLLNTRLKAACYL